MFASHCSAHVSAEWEELSALIAELVGIPEALDEARDGLDVSLAIAAVATRDADERFGVEVAARLRGKIVEILARGADPERARDAESAYEHARLHADARGESVAPSVSRALASRLFASATGDYLGEEIADGALGELLELQLRSWWDEFSTYYAVTEDPAEATQFDIFEDDIDDIDLGRRPRPASSPEDVLRAILSDPSQPRPHHHHFASTVLRDLVEGPAEPFLHAVLRGTIADYLTRWWEESGLECERHGIPALDGRGLSCRRIDLAGSVYVWLVTMPPPERPAEAYMVGVVREFGATLRYFTLERRASTELGAETFLCEWKDGTHLNFGSGPEPTEEAFVESIRARLG